jgi:hypothetical protein
MVNAPVAKEARVEIHRWSLEELVRLLKQRKIRRGRMKYRIGMWACGGFLVAGCWALYAFATTPPAMTSADPIVILVELTCPIALLRSHPLSLYFVLLANAATYALVGLIVETLRRRLKPAI